MLALKTSPPLLPSRDKPDLHRSLGLFVRTPSGGEFMHCSAIYRSQVPRIIPLEVDHTITPTRTRHYRSLKPQVPANSAFVIVSFIMCSTSRMIMSNDSNSVTQNRLLSPGSIAMSYITPAAWQNSAQTLYMARGGSCSVQRISRGRGVDDQTVYPV